MVAQISSQKKTKQQKRITDQYSLKPHMQRNLIKQNKTEKKKIHQKVIQPNQ